MFSIHISTSDGSSVRVEPARGEGLEQTSCTRPGTPHASNLSTRPSTLDIFRPESGAALVQPGTPEHRHATGHQTQIVPPVLIRDALSTSLSTFQPPPMTSDVLLLEGAHNPVTSFPEYHRYHPEQPASYTSTVPFIDTRQRLRYAAYMQHLAVQHHLYSVERMRREHVVLQQYRMHSAMACADMAYRRWHGAMDMDGPPVRYRDVDMHGGRFTEGDGCEEGGSCTNPYDAPHRQLQSAARIAAANADSLDPAGPSLVDSVLSILPRDEAVRRVGEPTSGLIDVIRTGTDHTEGGVTAGKEGGVADYGPDQEMNGTPLHSNKPEVNGDMPSGALREQNGQTWNTNGPSASTTTVPNERSADEHLDQDIPFDMVAPVDAPAGSADLMESAEMTGLRRTGKDRNTIVDELLQSTGMTAVDLLSMLRGRIAPVMDQSS